MCGYPGQAVMGLADACASKKEAPLVGRGSRVVGREDGGAHRSRVVCFNI